MSRRDRVFSALAALLGGVLLTCFALMRLDQQITRSLLPALTIAPALLGLVVSVHLLKPRRASPLGDDPTRTGAYRRAPDLADAPKRADATGWLRPIVVSLAVIVGAVVFLAIVAFVWFAWIERGPG